MNKFKLNDFAENIVSLWNQLDKDTLFNSVLESLQTNAILVGDWPCQSCVNKPGLYCFWYVDDMKEYSEFKSWYEKNDENKYKISRSYDKWYNAKDAPFINISVDNIPARSFYLGKREQLNNRITQHIGVNPGSKSTHGMHLNRLTEIYEHLYVGYWHIPEDIYEILAAEKPNGKYIIQQLLVYIESQLRNKLKPMVGKQ